MLRYSQKEAPHLCIAGRNSELNNIYAKGALSWFDIKTASLKPGHIFNYSCLKALTAGTNGGSRGNSLGKWDGRMPVGSWVYPSLSEYKTAKTPTH